MYISLLWALRTDKRGEERGPGQCKYELDFNLHKKNTLWLDFAKENCRSSAGLDHNEPLTWVCHICKHCHRAVRPLRRLQTQREKKLEPQIIR